MEAVRVPQMDLTSEVVSVERWLVSVGSLVSEGDDIAEIGTEKATVVLAAPVDGCISAIEVPAGQSVRVGATIAYIEPHVLESD